eukprot:7506315-Pyramimonas_sp.AAC.1
MGDKMWSYFHGLWLHEKQQRSCHAGQPAVESARNPISAAYFPHGGYGDKHVQKLYDELGQIHLEAYNNKFATVIGGDFNARIGTRAEDDNK